MRSPNARVFKFPPRDVTDTYRVEFSVFLGWNFLAFCLAFGYFMRVFGGLRLLVYCAQEALHTALEMFVIEKVRFRNCDRPARFADVHPTYKRYTNIFRAESLRAPICVKYRSAILG